MGVPPTPQTKPGECVGETIYQGEFGGAQFVGPNENWTYDCITPNTEFDKHYANAITAMDNKVAELQRMVNSQTTIPLYEEIDTALKKCNQSTNIADNITANYIAIAPVFLTMEDSLDDNKDFHKFRASYYRLVQNAYNNSRGGYSLTTCKTNSEIEDPYYNSFFTSELAYTDLSANDLTNSRAETEIKNLLEKIAQKTKTSPAVLKKIIGLSLYNESLYGLNDFAQKCNVQGKNLNNEERSLSLFKEYIKNAAYSLQNLNDGRTM